jgi:hypothetical protein
LVMMMINVIFICYSISQIDIICYFLKISISYLHIMININGNNNNNTTCLLDAKNCFSLYMKQCEIIFKHYFTFLRRNFCTYNIKKY